ncbi:MAG: sulfur oxidation c-type cytochrome SoxA, partial [Gammaproteobacteria bacterium]|nr:sulfur oxidation c-type cytochrome SoxA [Gammaproteobacteria bacterium]
MMKYNQFTIITLLITSLFFSTANAGDVKSGSEYVSTATREMQNDEFANPGMTAVEEGKVEFHRPGVNDKTCASCHGKNGSKFDLKKIANYPIYNKEYEKPFTLQEQINYCGEEHLDNVPYVYDCVDLVEIEAYVRYLARGEKVNVKITKELKPFYEKGKKIYNTRYGQMNMACTVCHDQYAGQHLRGQVLSQGQSNGFPLYRLGSGKMTSLHARIKECFISFRAEPFHLGSEELISLELYLHKR